MNISKTKAFELAKTTTSPADRRLLVNSCAEAISLADLPSPDPNAEDLPPLVGALGLQLPDGLIPENLRGLFIVPRSAYRSLADFKLEGARRAAKEARRSLDRVSKATKHCLDAADTAGKDARQAETCRKDAQSLARNAERYQDEAGAAMGRAAMASQDAKEQRQQASTYCTGAAAASRRAANHADRATEAADRAESKQAEGALTFACFFSTPAPGTLKGVADSITRKWPAYRGWTLTKGEGYYGSPRTREHTYKLECVTRASRDHRRRCLELFNMIKKHYKQGAILITETRHESATYL